MKFFIISHGDFAEGLLSSISMLIGQQDDVFTFGLFPEDDPGQFTKKLEAALEPEDEGNAVFFSDLYFGTPFNCVVNLSQSHDIYHLTGINLPVLIEAFVSRNRGSSAEEVCADAMSVSEESIKDARMLLVEQEDKFDEREEF